MYGYFINEMLYALDKRYILSKIVLGFLTYPVDRYEIDFKRKILKFFPAEDDNLLCMESCSYLIWHYTRMPESLGQIYMLWATECRTVEVLFDFKNYKLKVTDDKIETVYDLKNTNFFDGLNMLEFISK